MAGKSVFVIYIDDADKDITTKITGTYPGSYRHSDHLVCIETEDLPSTVKSRIGLDGSDGRDGPSGAIFKLGSSAVGFTSKALWEWLGETESMSR